MAGRPERFVIEIFAKPEGGHAVVCDYVRVTSESTPPDQLLADTVLTKQSVMHILKTNGMERRFTL